MLRRDAVTGGRPRNYLRMGKYMFDSWIDTERRSNGLPSLLKQESPSQISTAMNPLLPFTFSDQFHHGDPETLSRVYENLVVTYRAINFRADNLARLPLKVVQVKGDEEIDISESPDFAILYEPNSFLSQYDFYYESSATLDITGELYWQLERGSRNRISAMFNDWRAWEVKVNGHPTELISSYTRRRNGAEKTFPAEDVFYIKYYNPWNILRGMSPLQAARHNLILSLNGLTFLKNFFKNGMFPGATAETEQQLSEPVYERVLQQLKATYGGLENMHGVMILEEGLNFNIVDRMSLNESEILPLLEMDDKKIATAYGVPLELLNMGKGDNSLSPESLTAAEKYFWGTTMVSYSTKFLAEINRELIPQLTRLKGVKVKHDFSGIAVLQEDLDNKAERFFQGFGRGAVTPNDIAEQIFGLERSTNPAMDFNYLPINVIPVGTTLTEVVTEEGKQFRTEGGQEDLEKAFLKNETIVLRHIPKFERSMVGYFAEQESSVLDAFDSLFPTSRSFTKIRKKCYGSAEDKEKALKQAEQAAIITTTIYDRAKFDQLITDILAGLTVAAMFDASLVWDGTLTPEIFAADILTTRFVGERVVRFSDINQTTKDRIQSTLQAGFAAGEDIPALRDRVQLVFSQARAGRASLIARTEAVGSVNAGNLIGGKRAGFRNKVGLTSRDAVVREAHQPIDNVVVPIEADLPFGAGYTGLSRQYPSDFNERCTLLMTNRPVTRR